MVSVNFQNEKVYSTGGVNKIQTAPLPLKNSSGSEVKNNTNTTTLPSFKAGGATSAVTVRTQLNTNDEKKKYKELSEALDGKYKRKLEYALKSGILLKNDSDDNSSVLDNLHKILKEERDKGKSIIYSTHYMEEAENICDRVVLIHKGKIVKEGTPKDIIKEIV